MSSMSASVQDYIARQPRLAWRRRLVRGFTNLLGFRILWRLTVTGMENVPAEGPTILMMNHTSLLDPVIFIGVITKRFVIPMTKIENVRSPLIGPIVFMYGAYSVNRGEVDRKALMNSIELVKSGQLVLIAPEGHRHPEGLARPKDGLAYVATKSDAIILPAGVAGGPTWKEDLFHFRRTRIRVNFGRPFRLKTDGRSRIPRDELRVMMDEAMYQLALALPDESLRGEYSDMSAMTSKYIEHLAIPEQTPKK
jgi:1-acyl-sn-glycerol-3-phosphate acyltransferase